MKNVVSNRLSALETIPTTNPSWHASFLRLLPGLQRHARISFRHLDPEARAEAIQETTAIALQAYVRLFELGRADVAHAGTLAD